ncbi:MAG: cell division protein FtsW, partial [Sphingomonadales bacterium]|nr:cell division protein FtsW [Sphingomonadales bacterium]
MNPVVAAVRQPSQRLGRSDRSAFGLWFWEIDRVLLLLVFILISVGLIAVAAASPAAADRYSGGNVTIAPLHYFWRQLGWVALGLPVMIGVSMLPTQIARRFALGGAAFFGVMLMLVPLIGSETNGARRWIGFGIAQFQPSEFLKPFFVVSLAWLLSLRAHDRTLPVIPLSGLLTGLVAVFLMKQPDFGQTIVFATMWLALLMLSGVSTKVMGGLGVAGIFGIVMAYLFYPVAKLRIDNFLFSEGDTYQTDSARATLTAGGFFGTGPGGGEMKFHLPEAHTDYIFSVIGEEFGLIACAIVVLLYAAIAVRVLLRLSEEDDLFTILAAAGLTAQLVGQAFINIAVNLQLFPSKGMTLPLISYGGSS